MLIIFRTFLLPFYPTAECGFLSNTQGPLPKINHRLDNKTISKFKKPEIVSSTFSDHNGKKLEISNK